MTDTLDPAFDVLPASEKFKMFTGLLKASRGGDGKMRLQGIASSTTRDLHGDVMTESALRDMERDANNGLTIFLNHSYDVPEDVAGSATGAKVTPRGVDGDGNPNFDLDMEVVIDQTNPRAIKSFESIESGTKLGLSIGAMIPEGGAKRDRKTKALTIEHVQLMETSIVSIPANPRSWISNAVKALSKGSDPIDLGSPTMKIDGDEYEIKGRIDGISQVIVGKSNDADDDSTEPVEDKDIEPDVQDASVRIIEIDTDEPSSDDQAPSQGADDSEPDTEPAAVQDGAEPPEVDETPDIQEELDAATLAAASYTLTVVNDLTAKIAELHGQLLEAQEATKIAVAQRDETAEMAGLIMTQARTIIDKLADTPIGRKSKFREAANDFSHLEGIYDQRFLKLLQQGE